MTYCHSQNSSSCSLSITVCLKEGTFFCFLFAKALPCSGCFKTCMVAHLQQLVGCVRFSTSSMVSRFLLHSSNWACCFGCFFQYTPRFEVWASSFDTNFNYEIIMLEPRPSFNHQVNLQQLWVGRWFSKLGFLIYSQRQIWNVSSVLLRTQVHLLNFLTKCLVFFACL